MSKRTWNKLIGNDFDYFYLLKLEQMKIRRMYKNIKKHSLSVSKDIDCRDLALCDRLITIILEEDPYYKKHLHETSNKDVLTEVVYVNDGNEIRFYRKTPIYDNMNDDKPYKGEEGRMYRDRTLKMSLRRLKAMHLYNMIREYRMWSWWW